MWLYIIIPIHKFFLLFRTLLYFCHNSQTISLSYHVKEIDKSLITTLEHKINLLGMDVEYSDLIKKYKNRLEEYKKKLGIE